MVLEEITTESSELTLSISECTNSEERTQHKPYTTSTDMEVDEDEEEM